MHFSYSSNILGHHHKMFGIINVSLPVLMVSKKPISCFTRAPNSSTFILQVKLLIAHMKRPPRQPALKELQQTDTINYRCVGIINLMFTLQQRGRCLQSTFLNNTTYNVECAILTGDCIYCCINLPSQRVKPHEDDCCEKVIPLVLGTQDVNHFSSVEWDEHLT